MAGIASGRQEEVGNSIAGGIASGRQEAARDAIGTARREEAGDAIGVFCYVCFAVLLQLACCCSLIPFPLPLLCVRMQAECWLFLLHD